METAGERHRRECYLSRPMLNHTQVRHGSRAPNTVLCV